MNAIKVGIVDYGTGNLFSVAKSLEAIGADVELLTDPAKVENAERLVLPGVGAFPAGMRRLKDLHFDEAITLFAERERPILGICLGMQLFADVGHEFVTTPGLGLVPGMVREMRLESHRNKRQKIPFISWIELREPSTQPWGETIFEGIEPGSEVYVVHSFEFIPADKDNLLAVSHYGAKEICVAVQERNIVGCQFHPEKSGIIGQKILKNFIEI